jgi:hypothetical protein
MAAENSKAAQFAVPVANCPLEIPEETSFPISMDRNSLSRKSSGSSICAARSMTPLAVYSQCIQVSHRYRRKDHQP